MRCHFDKALMKLLTKKISLGEIVGGAVQNGGSAKRCWLTGHVSLFFSTRNCVRRILIMQDGDN